MFCFDLPLLETQKRAQEQPNEEEEEEEEHPRMNWSEQEKTRERETRRHLYMFTSLRQGHVDEDEREGKRERLGNAQWPRNV